MSPLPMLLCLKCKLEKIAPPSLPLPSPTLQMVIMDYMSHKEESYQSEIGVQMPSCTLVEED